MLNRPYALNCGVVIRRSMDNNIDGRDRHWWKEAVRRGEKQE
jgi:hypothetical protein